MNKEQAELFRRMPKREVYILLGIKDDTYQQYDSNRESEIYGESQRLNVIYNKLVAERGARTPYYSSSAEAGRDSINFLKENGISESQILRAEQWLSGYNPQSEAGIESLFQDFKDECGKDGQEGNPEQILASLNMTKDELVAFKNAYVAHIMTQLVGGLVEDTKGKGNHETIRSTGEASVVIGLPGAGKSTTIKEIKNATNAYHIDADAMKAVVAKTFGVSINANGMHQLSSYIRNELVSEAQREKVNLIVEKIGDNPRSIEKAGKGLSENGYKVGLSLVHVKNSRSHTNNTERANSACKEAREKLERGAVDGVEPPRMVEPRSINKFGDGPLFTYLQLRENRENSPFSSFGACCNEPPYLGKDTAAPIVLYGISDPGTPGCDIMSQQVANEGFAKLQELANDVAVEYLLSINRSNEPSALRDFEFQYLQSIRAGKTMDVSAIVNHNPEFAQQIEATDKMRQAMVNVVLRHVYNPNKLTKDNNLAKDLEMSDVNTIKKYITQVVSQPEFIDQLARAMDIRENEMTSGYNTEMKDD